MVLKDNRCGSVLGLPNSQEYYPERSGLSSVSTVASLRPPRFISMVRVLRRHFLCRDPGPGVGVSYEMVTVIFSQTVTGTGITTDPESLSSSPRTLDERETESPKNSQLVNFDDPPLLSVFPLIDVTITYNSERTQELYQHISCNKF